MNIDLRLGDCLEIMPEIPDKSVDMILCDLPYGTTAIKWDKPLPLVPLWEQYERIIKYNGAIVLFSAQPFTTDLIVSNRKLFRYEIIWNKTTPTGFLNANKAPLRTHENICVFYKKLPTYNPINRRVDQKNIGRVRKNGTKTEQYSPFEKQDWRYTETGKRFPTDVVEFSNWNGVSFGNVRDDATKHPTQKPVDLCKYLIFTYTNPGDIVLDNCMGSGSTGVACVQAERRFVGIELNQEYFSVAENRIKTAQAQPNLFLEGKLSTERSSRGTDEESER